MGDARWVPTPIWRGQPCYIIGGGPSLKNFPFEILRGKNVLGCNAAFYLGVKIVPITIFGDSKFLSQHQAGLSHYVDTGGKVVTHSTRRRREPVPQWLLCMKKVNMGLATDGLGWNGNTGASAINLALLLGADIIYLLGYDMCVDGQGRANFHNAYVHPSKARAYLRFLRGMKQVAMDLPQLFPGRSVINLEDGTSVLNSFPKESLKAHFAEIVDGVNAGEFQLCLG